MREWDVFHKRDARYLGTATDEPIYQLTVSANSRVVSDHVKKVYRLLVDVI